MKGRLLATVLFGVLMASGGEAWALMADGPKCANPCGAWDSNCRFHWDCCTPGLEICGDNGCESACGDVPCLSLCPQPAENECATLTWDANDCRVYEYCGPEDTCGWAGCEETQCYSPVCRNGRPPCQIGRLANGCPDFTCCSEGTACVERLGCVVPRPPPVVNDCDGLEGACFGLCNAFCNAIKCQASDQVNRKPCDMVLRNYSDPKHGCPPMPCLQPPEPEEVCVQFMKDMPIVLGYGLGYGGYGFLDGCFQPAELPAVNAPLNVCNDLHANGFDYSGCSLQSCGISSSEVCDDPGETFATVLCVEPTGAGDFQELLPKCRPVGAAADMAQRLADANHLCEFTFSTESDGTCGVDRKTGESLFNRLVVTGVKCPSLRATPADPNQCFTGGSQARADAAQDICTKNGYARVEDITWGGDCIIPGITNVWFRACYNPECAPVNCPVPSCGENEIACGNPLTTDPNGCQEAVCCDATTERCGAIWDTDACQPKCPETICLDGEPPCATGEFHDTCPVYQCCRYGQDCVEGRGCGYGPDCGRPWMDWVDGGLRGCGDWCACHGKCVLEYDDNDDTCLCHDCDATCVSGGMEVTGAECAVVSEWGMGYTQMLEFSINGYCMSVLEAADLEEEYHQMYSAQWDSYTLTFEWHSDETCGRDGNGDPLYGYAVFSVVGYPLERAFETFKDWYGDRTVPTCYSCEYVEQVGWTGDCLSAAEQLCADRGYTRLTDFRVGGECARVCNIPRPVNPECVPPPVCESPTPCVIGSDCDVKCRTYCDCTRTGCAQFDRERGCTCVECGAN